MNQVLSKLPWDSPEFYREVHPVIAKRVQFVEHKGKRILVSDFTEADPQLTKAIAAECFSRGFEPAGELAAHLERYDQG